MVLCLKARESRSLPGLPRKRLNLITTTKRKTQAHKACVSRYRIHAGWSSPVARQAHNLKVAGSNPAPATKKKHRQSSSDLAVFSYPVLGFAVSDLCPDRRSAPRCGPVCHSSAAVCRGDTACAVPARQARHVSGVTSNWRRFRGAGQDRLLAPTA